MAKHVEGRLKDRQIRNAKGPARLLDGAGLYLTITESGARSWVLRVTVNGRQVMRGLGGYPDVGLAEARDKARMLRAALKEGRDVRAQHLKIAPGKLTFEQAFDEMWAVRKRKLANPKAAQQWPNTMRDYVFPHIGQMSVADVTPADILRILDLIWDDKPETARRVLQRLEVTFKSAILRGHREKASPCLGISGELGQAREPVKHHRSMPLADVPAFIERLRAWPKVKPISKLALEFITLTACRSGEVRRAEWSEIDLTSATWTIPAQRMKSRRVHRVPLCDRAVEILEEARIWQRADWLFPNPSTGEPLSDSGLTKLLRDAGLDVTVHGFRATFKTWADETGIRDLLSELSLAHVDPNRVRDAYRRSDLLEERREVMAKWSKIVLPEA